MALFGPRGSFIQGKPMILHFIKDTIGMKEASSQCESKFQLDIASMKLE